MLGSSLCGSTFLANSLPPAMENPFQQIARGRGVEFAVILEIVGFPKQLPQTSGGTQSLLMHTLLGGPGLPGEELLTNISTRTVLLSDVPYRTKPSDPLRPNIWTEARQTRRADIEQSAPISQGSLRRSQDTLGDMEFADNERFLLDITDNYSFKGRTAQLHVVPIGKDWTNATTIIRALVKETSRSKNAFRVSFKDAADLLGLPISPRIYRGTGGRDGYAELKGLSPPMGWGECKEAKPLLEDPSIYLYRLSDESINAVHKVEERGLPFTFDADYTSYDLLRGAASGIPAGSYATCIADGSLIIKFSGGDPLDPDAIRVNFEGVKSSGVYRSFWGDVLYDIARYTIGIPNENIDVNSFQVLPQYKISYYFPGGSSPTGTSVFNTIMESGYGLFGSVNDDRLGVKEWFPPATQSATATFPEDEIFSVSELDPRPQEPIWSQTMTYGPNQNPLSRDQLAVGSLTEPQIQERTRDFEDQYINQNPNIKASILDAVIGSTVNSVFDEKPAVQDSVDRVMGVWGVDSKPFEVELAFVAADVKRGQTVNMTHRDFGEKSGSDFLVYNKRIKGFKKRVVLTVVG